MNSYLFTLGSIDGITVSRFIDITAFAGMSLEEAKDAAEMAAFMDPVHGRALQVLATNISTARWIAAKLGDPCYQVDCEVELDTTTLERLLEAKQAEGTLQAWLAEREV